ncbi:MAG: hypothetical protein M0Z55_13410 [Peptococcaceae bacterium]|nr:hypothetical protein [Peptococcaceae bacterium]
MMGRSQRGMQYPGQMPGQMPGQYLGQYPGQMPMGQMPQGQAGAMGPGGSQGGRLFGRNKGGKPGMSGAPGGMQPMPGMAPMAQQYPAGMQAPVGGGRSRRPGLMSKMSGQQQAYPAGTGQVYAPNYAGQSQVNQGAANVRGMARSRYNPAPQQVPQAMVMPQMAPQPATNVVGKQIKPKQFSLKPGPVGLGGTGIAKINGPNSFSLIANDLPEPESLAQNYPQLGPNPVYVAYLTNRKGRDSFTVGQLMPVGSGTYRGAFQSNVPFYEHEQVIVTLENPYNVQNMPTGPVVLTSASGAGILVVPKPVKRFFGGVWEKVKGVGKGIGKKKETPKFTPEFTPADPMPTTPNLFGNYTLGPAQGSALGPASGSSPGPMFTDLPGLGPALEDPRQGGNP